jgi:hypothetical protein
MFHVDGWVLFLTIRKLQTRDVRVVRGCWDLSARAIVDGNHHTFASP